mmetsp:Transcript_44477/g.123058  ORF Transcript_44477/g.123058 Transcript_44477/m.123058 type:complete len:201 (+) Transcript_44477:1194-1796(+)
MEHLPHHAHDLLHQRIPLRRRGCLIEQLLDLGVEVVADKRGRGHGLRALLAVLGLADLPLKDLGFAIGGLCLRPRWPGASWNLAHRRVPAGLIKAKFSAGFRHRPRPGRLAHGLHGRVTQGTDESEGELPELQGRRDAEKRQCQDHHACDIHLVPFAFDDWHALDELAENRHRTRGRLEGRPLPTWSLTSCSCRCMKSWL